MLPDGVDYGQANTTVSQTRSACTHVPDQGETVPCSSWCLGVCKMIPFGMWRLILVRLVTFSLCLCAQDLWGLSLWQATVRSCLTKGLLECMACGIATDREFLAVQMRHG